MQSGHQIHDQRGKLDRKKSTLHEKTFPTQI